MVEVVEPDLIAKHTLYAVAWGIIRLPEYTSHVLDTEAEVRQVARERMRIKKACIAYAKARGFNLELRDNWDVMENWNLTRWSAKDTFNSRRPNEQIYNSFVGTLQQMCLRIVEHDTWPEGKPEDAP